MALFDDNTAGQIRELLSKMQKKVHLAYFTQEFECPSCRDAHDFVEEFSSLSDNVTLEELDLVKDSDRAKEYGIEKIPSIVVLDEDKKDYGIRFFGLPGGYEINSFLQAIIEMSGARDDIEEDIRARIKAIDKPVHIQVFVTLSCPYCPGAVTTAHRLAMESDMVRADMIEANTFVDLSQKYNVSGVPKVVINEEHEILGAQPMADFLAVIEKL